MASNVLSVTNSDASYNIPDVGALTAYDWASWGEATGGTGSITPTATKTGGGGVISLALSGGGVEKYTDDIRTKSATGPTVSGTFGIFTDAFTNGVYMEFTLPADTTVRTARIWVSSFDVTTCTITTTLSDGSVGVQTNNTALNSPSETTANAYIDVTYAAASASQTMKVRVTGTTLGSSGFGNVGTMAAAVAYTTTGPVITDVDTDENVYNGQSVTVTGTGFGTTNADRTFTLEQGAVSIAQTETGTGTSTTAQLTIATNPAGPGNVGIKCGAATLKCTLTAGGANGSLAVTISMAAGQLYVDVLAAGSGAGYIEASSLPADGCQCQIAGDSAGTTAAPAGLTVYPDLAFVFSGATAPFYVRFWDVADSTFGTWGLQSIGIPGSFLSLGNGKLLTTGTGGLLRLT